MSKTIVEKLQIKLGSRIFVTGHDDARLALLGTFPEGAVLVSHPRDAEVAVLFADDGADLDAKLDIYLDDMLAARAVWILYMKANRSDINRDSIWARVKELDWRLSANVAIDDVWSAVRARRD